MKAKEGVLELLNQVLKAELTAVHQYLLHAGLCKNWGYQRYCLHGRARAGRGAAGGRCPGSRTGMDLGSSRGGCAPHGRAPAGAYAGA